MRNYIVFLFFFLGTAALFAQTTPNGITYQAVIYNPTPINFPGNNLESMPMTNKALCIQFTLVDATSQMEYQETIATTTDQFGMVNLIIGSGTQSGGYATSYNSINWSSNNKSLRVALDTSNKCSNFLELSSNPLSSVPFALSSITANNVTGVVALVNGGTGATNSIDARTNLGLGNVNNTSDINKIISTATKTYVDTQVSGATIADASAVILGKIQLAGDLAGTATAPTVPGLALKANTTDLNTGLALKANSSDVSASLALKANVIDLTTKENAANKSTDVTFSSNSDVKFPTEKATKTYVDSQVAGATIADASSVIKGKIQLAGDLAGTATAPTVPGLALKANTADLNTGLALKANSSDVNTSLALKANVIDLTSKENAANKSTDVTFSSNSDAKFPTEKATKTYVDSQVAGATIADASSVIKGKIQLAGDLAGTAAAPTVPGLALKANTTDLNTETIRAIGVEATLTTNIAANTTAIAAETIRATAAETVLSNATAINTSAITTETTRATGVEVILTTNIATNTTAIAAETTRATGVEATLTTNIATNTTAIAAETTRATGVEATLATNIATNITAIAAETIRATVAETTLSTTTAINTTAIAAETTRGIGVEATLATNIATNIIAIAAETTRATGVEATLATNIASNTTAIAAETTRAIAVEALKENTINKSTNVSLGTSDILFPTQNAVKTYIDASVSAGAPDASPTVKGIVTLAGDLEGTSFLPTIKANSITSIKIADGTIIVGDLATDAVETVKIKDANITNAKLDKANIPLSGFGAAITDVALGAKKLTGVADPTAPQDAATKNYVDTANGTNADLTGMVTSFGNATTVVTNANLTGDVTSSGNATTIGASKVLTGMIADGTITAADIADGAVTNAKIADGTLTNADLATVDTKTFKGRTAAGTGAVEDLTVAQVRSDLAINNVDNTTDAAKPVSTATQNAINLKANIESPTLTGTPLAPTANSGTNTTQIATTAFVAAANATNANLVGMVTSAGNATTVVTNANLTGDITSSGNATTIGASKVLTGMIADGTITTADIADGAVTSAKIADGAVTNANLTTVDTKTFKGRTAAGTGVVEDLTVAQVRSDLAINNVDNTTDAAKPVSTATQNAINLKANIESPTLTGTPLAPTANSGTNTTQIATTAFVATANATNANLTGMVTSVGNSTTVVTNANLTGPITSSGNTTSVASQTGTGSKFVMEVSPTLVTPVIGVATGTSLSVSGQLTSIVATGTAPLVVTSTTPVANLSIGGNAATVTNGIYTSSKISDLAATTSVELAGKITDETGSGLAVFATSPTLVTPVIGAATGTSLSVSGQLTSTVATGTAPLVVTSTTPVANLSIGGNAATVTNGIYTSSKISDLAATTSAELAGKISDETGTGLAVFATSPTLVTPVIGAASGTSLSLTGTIASTSVTTGTLILGGGAGIAGVITAGSIQNTPIGSTAASTGTFTTLVAIGNTTVGNLDVIGATTLSSTLGVSGNTTVGGTTTLNGNTAISGTNTFTVGTGATSLGGALTVTGATRLNGSLTIPDGAAAGELLISDANGLASWSYSAGAVVSTSTVAYAITLAEAYVFYTGITNGTFTIPAAVAGNAGKEITVKNKTAFRITITGTSSNIYIDNDNRTAATVSVGNEASNNWVRLVSDGTQWVVFRALF